MSYPASTKDISKFELRNRIGVNVLALNGRTPYICRKGADYERTVNLLILEDGEKKHYVAIKSLERLLSMQNSKHKESQHFCNNCLQGFFDVTSRDNHWGLSFKWICPIVFHVAYAHMILCEII